MGMTLIGRRLSVEQWRGLVADPSQATELLYSEEEEELDLDKAWHGIHYLLNGSAWEVGDGAGEAVLGGDEVGEDNGYGPARLVAPDRVRMVAAALGVVQPDDLRVRFDGSAMSAAGIYPEIWDEEDVVDQYLLPYFGELQEFYKTAAAEGQAVLLAVT